MNTILLIPAHGDPAKLLAKGPGPYLPPWAHAPDHVWNTTGWDMLASRGCLRCGMREWEAAGGTRAWDAFCQRRNAGQEAVYFDPGCRGLLLQDRDVVVLPAYDAAWRALRTHLIVARSRGWLDTDEARQFLHRFLGNHPSDVVVMDLAKRCDEAGLGTALTIASPGLATDSGTH